MRALENMSPAKKPIESGFEDNTVRVLTHVSPESVTCGVTVANFGVLGFLWNDCNNHVLTTSTNRSTKKKACKNGVSAGAAPFLIGNGVDRMLAPLLSLISDMYLHNVISDDEDQNGADDDVGGARGPHLLKI